MRRIQPAQMRSLGRELCNAHASKQTGRARDLARQLAGPLDDAYWSAPALLIEAEVAKARSIVVKYHRAGYIKPAKRKEARGGAPGLGKRR